MTSKSRSFYWLPIIFAILACSIFLPSNQKNTYLKQTIKSNPGNPSATFQPSDTPIPSKTYTPTLANPSHTPKPEFSLSSVPTPIPLQIQLNIFDNLWSIVNDTYVYPDFNGQDWQAIYQEYRQRITAGLTNEMFYRAMREAISNLGDEHSLFLDPEQVAKQDAEFQGTYDYVGIGVLVSAVPQRNHAVVLSIFSNSPAETAALKPRDSIISVDDTPILDEDGFLRDIVRGPEGTTINMLVQTPGEEPREISMTRHRITGGLPIVNQVITTPEGKRIGYILLVTFDDSTIDEQVAVALEKMADQAPLDGLIIDNRMNGGGPSTVFKPILGYFVNGNLGSFVNRNEQRPLVIDNNDINGSSKVPLVVLVGSETASFGEIFAGILQDLGRAYLIGKTTGGNVEILWGYDLEDGSELWLANETFQPINHPDQNWEKTGIIPDLEVTGEFDEFSLENDPVVLAAINYLSER